MAKQWFQETIVDKIPNPFSSKQAQSQMQVDNQMQQTITTQTMIEQVDDTIEAVSLAAEMFQTQEVTEKTINRVSDNAILSLNMLAVSCEELYKEQDQKTIALAKKRAIDNFTELESKNQKIYELIEPHRKFINAALNGQKNLRYKSNRVRDAPTLFEKGTDAINQAFAEIIHSNQEFEKKQETMRDPEINRKLAAKHESELKEYNNDRYKQPQHQDMNRPNQSDLYFTKSGKKSKFIDKAAIAKNKSAKQAMEEDLYGPEPDVYDKILPRQYLNAVLKLSAQYSWMGISNPYPCQILVPTKEQRANHDKNRIMVLPCFPHNNCTLDVSLGFLELRIDVVKKYEEAYINTLKTRFTRMKVAGSVGLGYKSIEEQEKEMDLNLSDLE